MKDITFKSAATMARLIRDKEVSAEELVEAHLRRIEEVNPVINAIVLLTADAALADARAADSDLASGSLRGPLHGVPMTIKDAIETAGVVSTGGTMGRKSHVPERDATVVARLREAGAIMLGKTNLPELSLAGESDNLIYGCTNNPYGLDRTPSGSSGGEAAAIAAGISPFGLGSDVGGSVRDPAHACGIAGIKPTSGRVPRTGHYPSSDGLQQALWQIGPLARYVEDLALVLPLISGPDWRDSGIAPVPLGDPGEVDVAGLRVSYHVETGDTVPTPETSAAIRAAADALADLGLAVEEAGPPALERAGTLSFGIYNPDKGAGIQALLDEAGTTEAHVLTRHSMREDAGGPDSTAELADLLIEADQFRSEMLQFMEAYDVILCPVNSHPAVPHGTSYDAEYSGGWRYCFAYNVTGWPGAVVRAGTSPEGLPIGVQIVARPWRDDVALAVAGRIEEALGGWQRPPL